MKARTYYGYSLMKCILFTNFHTLTEYYHEIWLFSTYFLCLDTNVSLFTLKKNEYTLKGIT